MKKGIKVYLECVLVSFLLCAISIGWVYCISYFPKLNQAWANATGVNPLPWKEAKKILMTRLPKLIPCCFMVSFLLYVTTFIGGSWEDNDEEDNDDEKKN